jgi:ribosomal protein L37AE/L43A
MNRTRLPGQSWKRVASGVWRCSFCGKRTRDRYGHNKHQHTQPTKPKEPSDAT